ncbi:MAG: hypothetical protein ACRDUA_15905 [Micromonosporaceae bacterium]
MGTTPLGIDYPDIGDQVTPLNAHFQSLAQTADDAVEAAKARPWRSFVKTDGQNIAGDASTVVLTGWTGVNGDPGNTGVITYANGVLTVSEQGLYVCTLHLSYNSHTGGVMRGRISPSVGQAVTFGCQDEGVLATGNVTWQGVLDVGQTLTLQAIQNSGSLVGLQTLSGYNNLFIRQQFPI